ncbi:Gfo/Idh/MocA family protein [Radiobacillus sp. PE A8.2]|uniref:Gfo/Idh/MocA family protein n=1 Tax=Radiobacillus sp. PE A8.2 TaxID=3380349 RepID=UPI00388EF74B
MSIKIGMVGTGGFSTMHAHKLMEIEDVSIAAICGTSKQKADSMAEEFKGAKGFDQINDMLDQVELDAVYICTPPMAHGPVELALIERGIPFFVEKPLGVDAKIPSEIMDKIKEKSLVTSVGYHFRYRESVQQLKQLLTTHKLGMVTGEWMGSMPGVYWWKKQELSGGQFNEQTTHIVDILRFVAGEVDEVYAYFGNRVMAENDSEVTVADVGSVTMKMVSGVVATISNTCILPDSTGRVGLTCYTDKNIADWRVDQLEITRGQERTMHHDALDPYLEESKAFIHAITTGDRSRILSDYEDAFLTQQVTRAAYESAISGLPVKLVTT